MSNMASLIKASVENESEYSVRKKWKGAAIGGELGYQAVPDILLRKQRILGINNTELVVLLNITLHWWKFDKWPHPRPVNIAARMGVTTRTVERAIESLIKKDLLERTDSTLSIEGHTVRYFNMTKLVKKLNLLAESVQITV